VQAGYAVVRCASVRPSVCPYLASSRVVTAVMNTVLPDRGKLVTLIASSIRRRHLLSAADRRRLQRHASVNRTVSTTWCYFVNCSLHMVFAPLFSIGLRHI